MSKLFVLDIKDISSVDAMLRDWIMVKLILVLPGLALVNGGLSPVEVLNNKVFKMPDLRAICGNFKNVYKVGEKCTEQLNIVCGNLTLLLTSK